MAEVTGILESVTPKEGRTGTFFIFNVNGTEGSTFDGTLAGKGLELVGRPVKAYFVQKGKFTNVADVQPLNGEVASQTDSASSYVSVGPDRDERIRRQWAVNAAIAFFAATGDPPTREAVFSLANQFQDYATKEFDVSDSPTFKGNDEDIPWPN